jgi:hypothetical protein
MTINKLSGTYLDEEIDLDMTGTGGKIACFIGRTGNSGSAERPVDGTVITKYTSYRALNKPVEAGGIGEQNLLNDTMHDFFEETKLKELNDIGVEYAYVIDVGSGIDKTAWLTAVETALVKRDIDILAFIGTEHMKDGQATYSLVDLMNATYMYLKTETETFEFVDAFFTELEAIDDELISLTENTDSGIQKSRIGLCESLKFGKSVARVCLAPYQNEPAFFDYRSVKPGEFLERSRAEKLALQNAGIIFNSDVYVNGDVHPQMNLCTATSFASVNRPADALFHARFIADEVLKQINAVCFPFVKDNDVATNLVRLQTQIDTVIDSFIKREEVIAWNKTTGTGTHLTVRESDKDPYDFELIGTIQPINSITAINVHEKLNNASLYQSGL